MFLRNLDFRRLRWLLVTIWILLGFQNCSPVHNPGSVNTFSLSAAYGDLQQKVFAPQCLGCHNSGAVDFTSYTALMSGANIIEGNPQASLLYLAVRGGSMPRGGAPLSEAQIQAISDWISEGANQFPPTLPMAPGSLQVTSASSTQLNLSWLDQSNNEQGFKIERASSAAGPFGEIGRTTKDLRSYADTGLAPSTTYYYQVSAFNSAGFSSPSTVVSATTDAPAASAPSAPSNLSANSLSATAITLTWTDNSSNENNFMVERSLNGTTFITLAKLNAGVQSFTNSGLAAGSTYWYKVKAVNSAGSSNYSNTVSRSTSTVSFTSLNSEIFQPMCVGCHSGASARGGYDMANYQAVLTRVVSGNAATSILYQRTADLTMPRGAPLTAAQISTIADWINSGAPNN